eukprot:TRINITY_DN7306_c0_g1_i5.p1 TRINITY_DN7306_c0_g1~~TRINITY_DN7306_c0_g1_i5.p1  ORF type:complete len:588 (+),score=170.09 TRINITY_DN7306_c0_g1_i5:55-1818(+)
MAEYVEEKMEQMIPEVEELERVGILNSLEVKELVKRRKHFEYKIQKRTKKKDDFLAYIQYERNLKNLIEIRRANLGYFHKKDIIDDAINRRIHKMFIILCNRWQNDVKLWLSHIDWLKETRWNISVSKVYMRLLQVHNSNPKLWIAAAKFEFEVGSAENGRQIMLRGLRFHPESKLLHREYVKFELLFVEKLLARKKVLKIADSKVVQEKNDKDGSETEEDSKPKKESQFDAVDDKILNCDLVNLVVKSALDAIPEPSFAVSLLVTVRVFAFSQNVQQQILDILEEKFAEHPVTVDTKARLALEKNGNASDVVKEAIDIYRDALDTAPSQELIHLAFTTLQELSKTVKSCDILLLKTFLYMLKLGHEKEMLGIEETEFYLKLIDTAEEKGQFSGVLTDALRRYPQHYAFWEIKLMSDGGDKYEEIISKAHQNLNEADLTKFWLRFLDLMSQWHKSDEAYTFLEENVGKRNLAFLRVLFLDRAYEKGIGKARDAYKRYHHLPPFCRDFHKNMLVFECEQAKVDKTRVREIYQVLADQFGSNDIQVWLDWISWEEKSGRVLEVPNIVCRAEAKLESSLLDKFTTIRQMS